MGRWWCLGSGWCTYKYTHTQTQPVTLACTHQSQRTGEATRTSPHQHDHVSCDTYAGCYIVAMQIISNAIFVCFQQNGEMANDGEWFCDPTRVFAVRACLAAFVSVCVCVAEIPCCANETKAYLYSVYARKNCMAPLLHAYHNAILEVRGESSRTPKPCSRERVSERKRKRKTGNCTFS